MRVLRFHTIVPSTSIYNNKNGSGLKKGNKWIRNHQLTLVSHSIGVNLMLKLSSCWFQSKSASLDQQFSLVNTITP